MQKLRQLVFSYFVGCSVRRFAIGSPLLLYSIAATTDEFGDFTRTESSPIRSRPPKKTPPKTILEKEEEEEKKSAVSFKAQKGRRA